MREPRNYEAPLCAEVDGDLWFPEHGDSRNNAIVKQICRQCIHRVECAEWGIHNERHGIWGGITASERKQIRRKRNIILREEKSA